MRTFRGLTLTTTFEPLKLLKVFRGLTISNTYGTISKDLIERVCRQMTEKMIPKVTPSLDLYRSMIKVLTPVFGEGQVLIAGGCLRDLAYGYLPKDIDVFVNLDTELSLELVMEDALEALNEIGIGDGYFYNLFEDNKNNLEDYVKDSKPSKDGPSCVGVFEFIFDNLVPRIQIIAKPLNKEWNGRSLCETFDYNLVQQWLDDSLEVQGIEEVQKQIMERALYLKKTGDKKTEERIKAFLERTSFEPSNKDEHPLLFGKKGALSQSTPTPIMTGKGPLYIVTPSSMIGTGFFANNLRF